MDKDKPLYIPPTNHDVSASDPPDNEYLGDIVPTAISVIDVISTEYTSLYISVKF